MIQATTKPGQLKELVKTLVDRSLPTLKQQQGFVDSVVLTSETDRDLVVGISIWKTKEDADRYTNGQGRQTLDSIKPLLQHEPTFHTFNLEASTIHNVGIGRAAVSS